jgi:hypothetical protein
MTNKRTQDRKEAKIKQEYYLVSNEHTYNYPVRSFWCPNANGYTLDLNHAGLYTKDWGGYPTISKKNIEEANKHEDFLIHKDEIALLGKVMKCVQN